MKLISAILFGLSCGVFGWQFGRHCGVEPQVKDIIPTIKEIQTMVGCEKIDGKLSPDWRKSETQAKWNRAVFNQNALSVWPDEGE